MCVCVRCDLLLGESLFVRRPFVCIQAIQIDCRVAWTNKIRCTRCSLAAIRSQTQIRHMWNWVERVCLFWIRTGESRKLSLSKVISQSSACYWFWLAESVEIVNGNPAKFEKRTEQMQNMAKLAFSRLIFKLCIAFDERKKPKRNVRSGLPLENMQNAFAFSLQ